MTYTERMISILKLIFGKEEISTELLSSVMLAFAEGAVLTDEMTTSEIGEAISENWIAQTRASLIETVKRYNRQQAIIGADATTMDQISALTTD